MDKSEREDMIDVLKEETEVPMAKFDDFDECLLYFTEDEDGNKHLVYCYEDLVECFARKNNCTWLEAVEYVDYNVIRSLPYMGNIGGQMTTIPTVIHRINRNFTTLEKSFFEKDYSDD